MNINDPNENININDIKLLENKNYFDTIVNLNNKIYENNPNCDNIEVLKDKDYLKNYYIDIFGNRINAELKDYFSDYYAEINNNIDKDKCIKVKSKNIGNYMFIPNQFNTQKYLTNAYNIDYNRIINHSLNMLAKLFASSTCIAQGHGRRMFSRADILKSLDKNKVNRKVFIKKELTENPEFFKAFPHM